MGMISRAFDYMSATAPRRGLVMAASIAAAGFAYSRLPFPQGEAVRRAAVSAPKTDAFVEAEGKYISCTRSLPLRPGPTRYELFSGSVDGAPIHDYSAKVTEYGPDRRVDAGWLRDGLSSGCAFGEDPLFRPGPPMQFRECTAAQQSALREEAMRDLDKVIATTYARF